MAAPHLTVVVPTHQRRDAVLRLLRSLDAQTAPAESFEVVVAIDGSDDGTREAVDAHRARHTLRWLWQPRGGRAAACNAGARAAAGGVIGFLDDDMEPLPGFVAGHLEAHGSGAPLGVVGSAPIVAGPDAPPVVAYRAAGFARKLERLAGKTELAFNDVYTGNFSIRRDLFLAAGGYDEAFRVYGHEDYEMALRLGRAGVRFVFDTAAAARQHYAKHFRALAADVANEGRTAVTFALKFPEVAPALGLARYARRSPRTRRRLGALLALSRASARVPSLLVSWVEHHERRAAPDAFPALFARYNLVFDVLYWLGVARALHEAGAPRRRVGFHEVQRVIAGLAQRRGTATSPS